MTQADGAAAKKRWRARIIEWVLGFHGRPKEVARGLALGVFVGFTPPVGLQMVTAAILATLTHSSRAAAVAAVWITNPLTALPLYVLTYRVGVFMLPGVEVIDIRRRLRQVVIDDEGEWLNLVQQVRELVGLGTNVLQPMIVGGLIVGTLAGSLTYVLARAIIAVGSRHLPPVMGGAATAAAEIQRRSASVSGSASSSSQGASSASSPSSNSSVSSTSSSSSS